MYSRVVRDYSRLSTPRELSKEIFVSGLEQKSYDIKDRESEFDCWEKIMTSLRNRSSRPRRYRNYFFSPSYWLVAIKQPKRAWQNFYAALKYPKLHKVSRSVQGLISLHLGVHLYETVLNSRHDSPNVVEVGAFKGLSTVYLSLAASKAGKRIKSFELFSGLPKVNKALDWFKDGQFLSSIDEYEANLKMYGCRDVVDLTVGDARQKMLHVLGEKGFAIAFLDADLYEVTRDLLLQLWSVAKGGEIIIVHDTWSPGIRKAIDEFHTLSNNTLIETQPAKATCQLLIPYR